jgi:hypothetical protein
MSSHPTLQAVFHFAPVFDLTVLRLIFPLVSSIAAAESSPNLLGRGAMESLESLEV